MPDATERVQIPMTNQDSRRLGKAIAERNFTRLRADHSGRDPAVAAAAMSGEPLRRNVHRTDATDRPSLPPHRDLREMPATYGPFPAFDLSQFQGLLTALDAPATAAGVPIESVSQIGHLLRQRRKALGISQDQLAGKAGVGRRFISELENGKKTLEVDKVLTALRHVGIRTLLV